MFTISAKLEFYIPHSHSLKDKRMVRRRLTDRIRSKFNVSVAEVDCQDMLQRLVIGVATVSSTLTQAKKIMDEIIRYAEQDTEAELIDIMLFEY